MRRPGETLLTLSVGLAAVVVQLPIFDRWFSLLDEGYALVLADEVNRGKLLYRDVYIDAPLPGAFYLLAGWFRLVGTSIYASRLLAVGIFALFAMLTFRIARAVLPRTGALGFAVLVLCYRIWAFPHWHILSYSSVAATLLAAAVVLALRHADSGSRLALVASGACVGTAIICKQDYGLGVGGALGLVLLRRPRHAVLYAAPVVTVVAAAFAYFAAGGALAALIDQAFVRPYALVSRFAYTHLPPLLPIVHQDPALRAQIGSYFPAILLTLRWNGIAAGRIYRDTAVWDVTLKALYYLPYLVWVVTVARWARRGIAERHVVLLAYAGGFLLAFNPPRDWVHLMMVFPPTMILGTALFPQSARGWRRLPAALGIAGLAALAVVSVRLGAELRHAYAWPLTAARAGVYADASYGPIIEGVLRYTAEHAPPGTPVPAWPVQPMLEFLAGREGAGGFHVIWPGQDPTRDGRIIADLERRDVRTIIYSLSQYASLGSFRTNAPQLFDYLVDHYAIDAVFAHETFGPILCALARRPTAAPAQDTMLEAQDGAFTRVRWPFATVMAEQVGTAADPAIARVALDVTGTRRQLAFAYGTNPDRWLDVPSGPFTFTIAVDGPDPVELFRATLDPHRRLEDRRWVAATVDLTAWMGRHVALVFSITAPELPRAPAEIAGWAEPRLVE
jgi:hypothetical protein